MKRNKVACQIRFYQIFKLQIKRPLDSQKSGLLMLIGQNLVKWIHIVPEPLDSVIGSGNYFVSKLEWHAN